MFLTQDRIRHIHLIGICGTAMGNIAVTLKHSGFHVTGSDGLAYPPMSEVLAAHGIPVLPFREENVLDPDLIVIGNAIPRGNPEVEATLNRKKQMASLPEIIRDFFVQDRKLILVTGTHGKTSTTAMIGHILNHIGTPCSTLLGGVVVGQESGFNWLPDSRWFVLEGDEYDTAFFDKTSKFLKFMPDILVVNALEFDHADIFDDLEAVRRSFRFLLRRTPGNSTILANVDDPEVSDLQSYSHSRWLTFGKQAGSAACLDRLFPDGEGGLTIEGSYGGSPITWSWSLPGEHNARNGLAAIAASCLTGIDPVRAAGALGTFPGVRRRFQLRALDQARDIRVFEDFAHHPTAIGETLKGVRALYPKNRLVAVVEPASNTMRSGILADELADSLRDADEAIVLPVPGDKRHAISPSATGCAVVSPGKDILQLFDMAAFDSTMGRVIQNGDILVFMSNGTFQGALDRVIQMIESGT